MKSLFISLKSFKLAVPLFVAALILLGCGGNQSSDAGSDISPKTETSGDNSSGSTPEPANDAPQPESMTTSEPE